MAFDRRETLTLLMGDFLILAVSLWMALSIRNLALPSWGYFEPHLVAFLPMFAISLIVFYIAGLYEKQTRPIRRVMGVRILGAQATTVAIAAILFFTLPFEIAPKTILALYLVVSVVAEGFWRFYRMRRELATEKRAPALLVGSGAAVTELYEEVRENPRYLVNFVEHLASPRGVKGDLGKTIISRLDGRVQVVVLDLTDARVADEMPALYDHMVNGVTFLDFATLYEEIFDRVPLDHLNPSQIIESLPTQWAMYDAIKRLFDLLSALVGMVIAAPFVGIAAATLFLQNGVAFIHQERVGKGGRIFRIVKLRSRFLPYDDRGDPELQKQNYVTPFGRFLRKTRIDELPQLWNVFVGDLSFIGPRPELPKIVEIYEREIPHYHMRHLIVPGLSGWAQIHDYDAPRGPADVERTRRKVSFDLYYLKHRSFGLDLAVAMKSLRALLALSGT